MLSVPTLEHRVDIAVFGGSGFYSFLDDLAPVALDTPYGPPSEPPMVGTIGDRRVAFIPRHGNEHTIPAHRVNYRANVWAAAALGARVLIAPFACGSLRADLDRGDLVIVDQLVDRTTGRDGTFFDGPETFHVPLADPYHAPLGHQLAVEAEALGLTVHEGGTVVVISGPRFSTRAESRWHAQMGWDLVNMTQAPEAALAAEAGMAFVGIGLVTDYDAGLEDDPSVPAVTQEEVFGFLTANADNMRRLLQTAIPVLDLP
ncbi:MAG: S-methyl-5'-thioadenosine phosphorylase [Acidimicrobiales bacterium]